MLVKIIIPLLILATFRVLGAEVEPPLDPSDDFSPMLAMFALVAAAIAFFLIGLGIVAAAAVAASIAILVGLGIVSSAVFVGLVSRRFSSGLRTFHYLACAVIALPAGVGTLWLYSYLSHSQLRSGEILTVGSIAGVVGGLALAFLFDCLIGVIHRRLANWVESAQASAK